MTPKRFTDAIHIGTGEFAFCLGARTIADTRPPNGFRDIGNVDVYQLKVENETVQREGAYRGKKSVDAQFSIKQGLEYLFRCDELTKDNLLVLAMGTDLGNNARGAYADTAADVMAFTALAPSDTRYWYDLTVSDVETTHLTSAILFAGTPVSGTTQDTGDTFTKNAHGLANGDRVILISLTTTTGASLLTPYFVVGSTTNTFQLSATAGGSALALTTNGTFTYLAALVEDTDYELDTEIGRVRTLSAVETNLYAFLTAAAITSADASYMKSITPLEEASFEGMGRFLMFHAADNALAWDHRNFSCTITGTNFGESTGKAVTTFDFIVRVTDVRGALFTAKRAIND